MWFFKKKERKNTKKDKIEKLIAIRYTRKTWFELYPNSTEEEYVELNSPNDILSFVKLSIRQIFEIGINNLSEMQIVTIDEHYSKWLFENKKTHKQKNLTNYINACSEIEGYWDERLTQSNMTSVYYVVGIQVSMLLHELKNNASSYCLTQNKSEELSNYLKKVFNTDNIYIPGWITKGIDMPRYNKNLIQFANEYFNKNARIRYGKYMEQDYNELEKKDLFQPFPFVIPIVIQISKTNSKISLKETDESSADKILFYLTKEQKDRIYKMLVDEYPQITSISKNLVLPGQAYLNYIDHFYTKNN